MSAIIIVLAGSGLLSLGSAGAFVVIIFNIHRVDRSKRLNEEPKSLLDAATRRILGANHRDPRFTYTKRG